MHDVEPVHGGQLGIKRSRRLAPHRVAGAGAKSEQLVGRSIRSAVILTGSLTTRQVLVQHYAACELLTVLAVLRAAEKLSRAAAQRRATGRAAPHQRARAIELANTDFYKND